MGQSSVANTQRYAPLDTLLLYWGERGIMIPGIYIYHAVFTGNVKNYDEFEPWYRVNPMIDSLSWMP
jgi:hypothetical protein